MKDNKILAKTRNLDLVPADDTKLWTKPWYINKKNNGSNVGRLNFNGNPENYAVELEINIKEDFKNSDYYREVLDVISYWALGKDKVFFVEVCPYKEETAKIDALKKCKFTEEDDLGRKTRYVKQRENIPWILICIIMLMSGGFAVGFTIHNVPQGLIIGAAMGIVMGTVMRIGRKKREKNAEKEWRAAKKKRK